MGGADGRMVEGPKGGESELISFVFFSFRGSSRGIVGRDSRPWPIQSARCEIWGWREQNNNEMLGVPGKGGSRKIWSREQSKEGLVPGKAVQKSSTHTHT